MKDAPRLDLLLVERGLVESRGKAQALILAGSVRVGGEVVTKAGTRVSPKERLTLDESPRFVSRAGEKLDAALETFDIRPAGRLCLDAGASTGGFTDALLRRGARKVAAVDVGYGQLDWRLRNDERVAVMERTNIRKLTGENLPFQPDLVVADLSFISLLVALRGLLGTTGSIREAVVLVKPQFEAGPKLVGRGGLVRDPVVRESVIERVSEGFAELGFGSVGLMRAPVSGRRSGNREYPLHLIRGAPSSVGVERVREVVRGE